MKKRQDRDLQQLAQLYDQFAKRLYRYVLAFLGNPHAAEDVLQNVFLKLAKHPRRLRKLKHPESYLFRSVRNEATTFLRRRRGNLTVNSTDVNAIEAPSENVTEDRETLSRALSYLPDSQKEVITLKTYGELSFTEIGKLLSIPRDTAASRYRLGLEKLRVLLKRDADETD